MQIEWTECHKRFSSSPLQQFHQAFKRNLCLCNLCNEHAHTFYKVGYRSQIADEERQVTRAEMGGRERGNDQDAARADACGIVKDGVQYTAQHVVFQHALAPFCVQRVKVRDGIRLGSCNLDGLHCSENL